MSLGVGEACTAANRFLGHELVACDFTSKFAAAMGSLTLGLGLGRGTGPATAVGPIIDGDAHKDIHALYVASGAGLPQRWAGGRSV
ncbi:aldehyde dehydrogenase family protein [Arthrobacter sp. R3-55]